MFFGTSSKIKCTKTYAVHVVFFWFLYVLQVYEKIATTKELLGTFCGTTAPPTFVSDNIFIVLFVSDISNGGRGFRASYYKLEGII